MLDFTSVLYLGMRHPRDALAPWQQLTTGVPAALATPGVAGATAAELAALTGCQLAILAPSTLHAVWDLFGMPAMAEAAIYLDAGAYPVAGWGIERAVGRGALAWRFAHHDPDGLQRVLRNRARLGRRPVVVTDGACPGCGGLAPLDAYLELARGLGGLLVVDDTQALGILGEAPSVRDPYGRGGGGTLRRAGTGGADVLLVASLAKGLGVPLAMIAGGWTAVAAVEAASGTRVHSSPPSLAHLHAARRALALNRLAGDRLRRRLAGLVRRFRKRLRPLGLDDGDGLLPFRTLPLPARQAAAVHRRLLGLGVRTVLQQRRCGPGASISLLITTRHCADDIDRAADAIAAAVDRDGAAATIPLGVRHALRA